MSIPVIAYPVAVACLCLVCVCFYVYDLRKQVKNQAVIIREQNGKLEHSQGFGHEKKQQVSSPARGSSL